MSEAALFCARCAKELQPGAGDFYFVHILAVADPTPPTFSAADLEQDLEAEIRRLCAQLNQFSERELVEQVYRRVTIHLCRPCYRDWIENPAR